MRSLSLLVRLLPGILPVALCAQDTTPRPAAGTRPAVADSVKRPARSGGSAARVRPRVRPSALSRSADSIGRFLVFAPRGQRWFAAAARGKRLLVDIGRVDAKVDDASRPAFREAVAARSPVKVGTSIRIRGPWGVEDATVSGFDAWAGRVVATLAVSPVVDSLALEKGAGKTPSLAGSAFLLAPADSTVLQQSCDRAMPAALQPRVVAVRDSLVLALQALPVPHRRTPQPATTLLRTTERAGCFGPARALVAVHVRAPNASWAHERVVLVSEAGAVTPLRVQDLRLKAHEVLDVFDADGDGVDDLATRGYAEGAGAVSILRLDPTAKRLTRLASGFAWEAR